MSASLATPRREPTATWHGRALLPRTLDLMFGTATERII